MGLRVCDRFASENQRKNLIDSDTESMLIIHFKEPEVSFLIFPEACCHCTVVSRLMV